LCPAACKKCGKPTPLKATQYKMTINMPSTLKKYIFHLHYKVLCMSFKLRTYLQCILQYQYDFINIQVEGLY
jgi:hypothetical protein